MEKLEAYKKDLNEKGYAIVDNFLSQQLAEELNSIYLAEKADNWKFIDQVRENHYKHVFKSKNSLLPRENEAYEARFWRSTNLEQDKRVNEIFNTNFIDKIREVSGFDLQTFDNRCYSLRHGDHYRMHLDDYAGQINSIYYVNRDWIWDWGGILHVCDHEDEDYIKPIFPKFNRLVLLQNAKFRVPHFISQVSSFALNPRFSLVSFCQ